MPPRGRGRVVDPAAAAVHGRADQRRGRLGVRGVRVRTPRGDLAQRLERSRHADREDPDHLPDGAADRVVAGGGAVRLEDGHHQAHRLGGGEHQRRQPQTPADPVAAVGTALGLDRDLGLAQDRDVPPGGPLADAQPGTEALGVDPRAGLDRLQRAQRPAGGLVSGTPATVVAVPDVDRPEPGRS